MLLPERVKIFVARVPADFRKSYDGLSGMVREVLSEEPESGALFVFLNRRRDQVKILFWDRNGYAIFMKRLERGTFQVPRSDARELEVKELAMLLEGLDEMKNISVAA